MGFCRTRCRKITYCCSWRMHEFVCRKYNCVPPQAATAECRPRCRPAPTMNKGLKSACSVSSLAKFIDVLTPSPAGASCAPSSSTSSMLPASVAVLRLPEKLLRGRCLHRCHSSMPLNKAARHAEAAATAMPACKANVGKSRYRYVQLSQMA